MQTAFSNIADNIPCYSNDLICINLRKFSLKIIVRTFFTVINDMSLRMDVVFKQDFFLITRILFQLYVVDRPKPPTAPPPPRTSPPADATTKVETQPPASPTTTEPPIIGKD